VTDDDGPAIEELRMPEAERRGLLARLAERLVDPDGFDWETLENIEQLTARDEPTEEERRRALEWWNTCDLPRRDANER
jgi:hypothetical protein